MTEESNQEPTQEELEQAAAFDNLKTKADLLGITYKKNITFATLQSKVSKAMEEADKENEQEEAAPKKAVGSLRETSAARDMRMRNDNNLLIRVQITCHNPLKAKWEGEVLSVGNRLGQVKKMVKFGVPYHVPQIILNALEERTYQQHITSKDPRTGRTKHTQKQVPEFSITYLEPLTPEELKKLAHEQALEAGLEG